MRIYISFRLIFFFLFISYFLFFICTLILIFFPKLFFFYFRHFQIYATRINFLNPFAYFLTSFYFDILVSFTLSPPFRLPFLNYIFFKFLCNFFIFSILTFSRLRSNLLRFDITKWIAAPKKFHNTFYHRFITGINFIASGAVNLGQNYVTQIQQNEKVSQIKFIYFFCKSFSSN